MIFFSQNLYCKSNELFEISIQKIIYERSQKKARATARTQGEKITWRDGSERGTQKLEKVSAQMTNAISLKSNDAIHIGTIPILRQQRETVGGVRKMTIFADVQYYLC